MLKFVLRELGLVLFIISLIKMKIDLIRRLRGKLSLRLEM